MAWKLCTRIDHGTLHFYGLHIVSKLDGVERLINSSVLGRHVGIGTNLAQASRSVSRYLTMTELFLETFFLVVVFSISKTMFGIFLNGLGKVLTN